MTRLTWLAAFLAVLLQAIPCAAAAKTDVVQLLNGDRITCEIRKLDRGKLTVKTDGIGTISIEWDDVAKVSSPTTYDIELENGDRYFGALSSPEVKSLAVTSGIGTEHLIMMTVIRINPLKGGFFHRLDGSIDAGFNFTQANVQTQWTFDTSVSYRGHKWVSTLDADSSLTQQEDADRQTRNSLTLEAERLFGRRWSAVGFNQLQQNEELSLNLRSVLGGGVQRVVRQSNKLVLKAVGGFAFTNEQYAGTEDLSVGEAVAGMNLNWFTYDGRSTNLDVQALSFYAVSGEARTRLELNTSFKSDIVGDLYWSINVFESYNSKPPTGQKANDFGVTAAIGWSF